MIMIMVKQHLKNQEQQITDNLRNKNTKNVTICVFCCLAETEYRILESNGQIGEVSMWDWDKKKKIVYLSKAT